MKYGLFIFLILSTGVGFAKSSKRGVAQEAKAAEPEAASEASRQPASLRARFIANTGFQSGDYVLKKGPSTCLHGYVDVIKVEDYLSILVRDRAIITRVTLGKRTATSPSGQPCKTRYSSSKDGNVLRTEDTETCPGQTTVKVATVTIGPGTLSYSLVHTVNGKVIYSQPCELAKTP